MSTMDELKIETIPEPDIRECLESLKGLGWRFSLTPARHLRLEHPETPSAIFCTMDEIRNLGTAVLRQMCQNYLSTHRARNGAAMRKTPSVAPTSAKPPAPTPALSAASPATTAPRPLPQSAPAQVVTAPVVAVSAPAPVAPAAPAPEPSPSIQKISRDLLALAQKIARGEITEVLITPDMLGKTLLIDGASMLVEDGAFVPSSWNDPDRSKPPAAASKPAASEKQAAAGKDAKAAPGAFNLSFRHKFLLELLHAHLPESVNTQEIAQKHWQTQGFASVKSAYASFRQGLALLASLGLVTETRSNGTYRYMAVRKKA